MGQTRKKRTKTSKRRFAIKIVAPAIGSVAVCAFLVFGADLTKERVTYVVPGAHLDTQWQWTLDQTIIGYITQTIRANFLYFTQFPDYKFNFEGAYRYWLVKKYGSANPFVPHYTANDWATLVNYVKAGKWIPCGGTWNQHDVNIPSAESLIRQTLYSQVFFKDNFGVRSNDLFLPDCFGFGYALPTVTSHCGLKGFSTQKFDLWGGWFPTPFSIGRWIGVDGSHIIAALKPGNYIGGMEIRTSDGDALRAATTSFANGPGGQPGIWATYDYIGTGDQGGGPSGGDVSNMVSRINANGSNSIKVYCTSSGQLFDDLTPPMVAALPSFEGELLMRTHGTGCYTSWAPMKLKNRRNEQRGALTELACVLGTDLSGGTVAYPQDTITHAWQLTLAQQMHDVLTGTSIPDVYRLYSMPAYDSAYNWFNYALGVANDKVANSAGQILTTSTTAADGRIPLVLVNQLVVARTDVVEASVNFGTAAPAGIKVYNTAGQEVPSQILSTSGQNVSIAFIATVPPASYSTYEVAPASAASPADPSLNVNATTGIIENQYYRVTVNASGDISSVVAKTVKTGQELLSSPSRFEMRPDQGTSYPAWEIQYSNCSASPTYVTGTPAITVAENGPARVSLKVVRSSGSSQFTQYIRLGKGDAGKRVEVYNEINWFSTGILLKVGFPVTCSNANATWDLGIGTIQRPNMTSNRYEVPGQQWADMTSTDGTYGLSILNNCKYGWNKESNTKLNLTLIHSPAGGGYNYQQDQSSVALVGVHKFTYSFYGHAGDWTNGTVRQGMQLNQPIYAYQPAAARAGALSARQISFVSVDTAQVDIMAIKKAEKSDNIIVRVRESQGKAITNARLTFYKNIRSAIEVTGVEDTLAGATQPQISGNVLSFNLTKYKPRAFSIQLAPGLPVGVKFGHGGGIMRSRTATASVTVVLAGSSRILARLPVSSIKAIDGIAIVNASGKLVRKLSIAKSGTVVWNGRDEAEQKCSSGLYVVNGLTYNGQVSASAAMFRL